MPRFGYLFLAAFGSFVVFPDCGRAEPPALFDPPAPLVEKQPPRKMDLNRLESLKLYGDGLICERNNRLVEALKHLEKARQLNPESAFVLRALVPLYLALDRGDDSLKACERILEMDPEDFMTCYFYARQLKGLDRPKESMAALVRSVACPGLKRHPQLLMQIHMDLAVAQETAGDFVHAEESFRRVVEILDNPNTLLEEDFPLTKEDLDAQASEILERLGRLALKNQNYDRAKVYYQKAQAKILAKEPSRAKRLSYNLAEVLVAKGDFKAALISLDAYLAVRPQGIEAYQLKVDLLRKAGQADQALPFLEDAVSNDKNNDGLSLLLAREYHKEGRRQAPGGTKLMREAAKICLDLAKSNPGAEVYRELFSVWKDDGRFLSLIQFLDHELKPKAEDGLPNTLGRPGTMHGAALLEALHDDPALAHQLIDEVNHQVVQSSCPFHFNTTFFLAVVAQRAKELATAEKLYRKSLDNSGIHGTPQETEIYYGLLQVLWQGNKYQEIEDLCRHGLKDSQGPNRVLFYRELARSLAYLGKADEAIAQANHAVDLSSADTKLLSRRLRVSVYLQLNYTQKAIAECQELLKEYNRPEEIHSIRYILSAAYSQAKEVAKAVEQLTLILEESPDDPTAHNDLGYLWADNNQNLEAAEKHIRQALDLDHKQRLAGKDPAASEEPDNAAYIDSLGWVLFRRGRIQEAIVELEKAAALEGGKDDPVMWDHQGDVYARLKDATKARNAWRKSIALYEAPAKRPKDDRYKEVQHKLKMVEQSAHSN